MLCVVLSCSPDDGRLGSDKPADAPSGKSPALWLLYGLLFGLLSGRLFGRLSGLLVGRLLVRLFGWLFGLLFGLLFGRLFGLLYVRLLVWLVAPLSVTSDIMLHDMLFVRLLLTRLFHMPLDDMLFDMFCRALSNP